MRDNMALGDKFNRAATAGMVTLHQDVEQDRNRVIARSIEGRARNVMSAAFSKQARHEIIGPVIEVPDDQPRTGRYSDGRTGRLTGAGGVLPSRYLAVGHGAKTVH